MRIALKPPFRPPYLWMGPKGALWLEFTLDDSRETFLALAGRLGREFGAVVTERYGGQGNEDKEYWWLDVEGSSLLLMRKAGLGTALGGSVPEDVASLARLAGVFNAPRAGWRWLLWDLRSWLTRSPGES